MKILFIAPNYLPHIGGVEKHIYHLINELVKDNHRISILTTKSNDNYKSYEKGDKLEIIRLEKLKNRIVNRFKNMLYMIGNMKKILQYDIIHFHDFGIFYSFGILIYPILKIFGKKTYITFHGWEGDVPPKKGVVIKRKIVEKLMFGNICIGHFIEKWYGTKADSISYGGVNKKDISNCREEHVLYVGRLADDTGIWSYIKSWEKMSKKGDLKFIICGDGILKKEIEQYVKEKSMKNIIFKGFVHNVDKYLKDAKVIFTSGYLGILESFSWKKNVISIYDNELKKDYLTMIPNYEKMMWVVDDNMENIIVAINESMIDKQKRENAYQYALENDWNKVMNDYYKLWKTK